jgi:hypothetical protein
VQPKLVAGVKFYGRCRSGAIRDGVLLSIADRSVSCKAAGGVVFAAAAERRPASACGAAR